MKTSSSRAALALLMVLLGAGCADFDLEKQKLCERFPERCGYTGDGGALPDAGEDAGPEPDAGPPRVTDTRPRMPMAQAGSTLSLQVTAEAPLAGTFRYEWSATQGSLSAQEDSATTSSISWTAPPCLPNGTPPFVSATVINSQGPSTSVQFLVGGVPDCPEWRSETALSSNREFFTATLLSDGRVLVVGGREQNTPLASAELLDPATGTVTSTSPLAVARWGHSATLLDTGQVLVVGGRDASGNALTSAVLYDPGTGTWSAAGSLTGGRYLHGAVRMVGRRVLVAGGISSIVSLNSVEVYDQSTNTWSAAPPMTQHRHSHTLTALGGSGPILAVGGTRTTFGGGGVPVSEALATAELYSGGSGSNAWTSTGVMTHARGEGHSATLLGSGKVLVLAGTGASGPLRSGELYDPAARTWAPIADMAPPGRTGHGASLLGSGKVLVTGGSFGTPLKTAELYDPERNTWSAAGELGAARTGHAAITHHQGDVLLLGGGATQVERYMPGSGVWKSTGRMSSVRRYHTMTLLPSGQVLLTGGMDAANTRLATTELYDPLTGRWTASGSMATPRANHTATLLPSGRVLVTGGTEANAPAELFDPGTGTWSLTSAMNLNRRDHTATLLPSGRVLVTGGTGTIASAELYDPGVGAWTHAASMATARTAHTASLLASGKVLVTGGGERSAPSLATAELYDGELGTWAPAETMRAYRSAHTATTLPSGKVLIVGGFELLPNSGNPNLSSRSTEKVDSYDAESGQWTAQSSMSAGGFMLEGRHDHATVLLPDGRVLVTGGTTKAGGAPSIFINATSEVFSPATDSWRTTSRTAGARAGGHRAVLLPTGRVLVTGGTNDTGAELYIP